MKRMFTLRCFKTFFPVVLMLTSAAANATFTPVAVTGFNHDVVADGLGFPTTSTTISFDSSTGVNYVLVDPTYQATSTSSLPTEFLPASGSFTSNITPGLTYQLQPYNANNSLRLIGTTGSKSTDSLVFPVGSNLIGDVYILASSGSLSSNMTAIINFNDGTTQTYTATVNDWFGAATTNWAIQDIGRAERNSGLLSLNSTNDPKLYEFKVTLNLVNYYKTIRSITFKRTGGGGTSSVLNIMAITVDHQTCLPPLNLASSNITMTTADFSWTAVSGATSYEYAVTTTATPPASGAGITMTPSYNATLLNNGANYYFHVRAKCSGTSNSVWVTLPFTTIACPTVPAGTITVPPATITTVDAIINWTAVAGSNGYEVALTTSATAPSSGSTQSATTYNAINLLPGTTYYFWIRNMCASPSNSLWTSKSFITDPCPTAGTPTVQVNIPGSVTFDWPGTTIPGMVDYQYAVNQSALLPTTWQSTTSTTATVNNLIPGTTYYAHVRSACATTQSVKSHVQFVNPYPPCDSPVTVTVSNINMHGAKLTWSSSNGVLPHDYEYIVTTSANPPASGYTKIPDTTATVTGLVGGQKYYIYIKTVCGIPTVYEHRSLAYRKDSFTTTASCISILPPTVSNITVNSADIDWIEYPGVDGYEYVIDNNPSDPTTTGALITFNSLALGNLFSGTNYYFHLRVKCDATNYSPWVTAHFTTPSICTTPPAPVFMGASPTTADFIWPAVSGATQYQYSVTTTSTPATSNTFTGASSVKVISLNPGSSYYFHLRAYCSPNDISGWTTIPFNTISVSVGSIGNGKDYDVIVYPNPVSDVLNVEVSGKMHGKGKIVLCDVTGKILKQAEVNGESLRLDMKGLPQGIYLLKYRDEESAGVLRVQKM